MPCGLIDHEKGLMMTSHTVSTPQQPRKSIFKKLLPERLLTRTLTILITPVILVQLVIGIVFWNRHWSETTEVMASNIASNISAVVHIAEYESNNNDFFETLKTFAHNQFRMTLSRSPKTTTLTGPKPEDFPWRDRLSTTYLSRALDTALEQTFIFDLQEPYIIVTVQGKHNNYTFVLHKRQLILSATSLMIWWQVGAPLFFIFIAALFMRNQVRPLQRLATAVSEFGKGRDVSTFKPSGALEVRHVGHAFNQMRERIHKSIKHRTEMLAGISHDLKTPLTRMQLQLALQKDSPYQQELLEDVKEMQTMVEEYLGFAKGEGAEAVKSVAMSDFLRALFTKFPQDKLTITSLTPVQKIQMHLRPYAMKRAFSNIISNALRYGGHLWFSCTPTDHTLILHFEDNGPGIPEEAYEDVFRPFYRLDASRNTETGGYGLGLSIARDIIETHGGSIELSASQDHKGLNVTVILPL